MSIKRPRDSDDDDGGYQAQSQPTKRARTVDLQSANLWNDLAEGDIDTRTEAAHALITKNCLCSPPPTVEQAKHFARRLFSGLASGRHSARPGFYACLAGALSIRPHAFGCDQLKLENLVSALRKSTKVDKGLGKQAARDVYYGKVLGCKCLLDSGILLADDVNATQALEQTLQVLCETAKAKIWLAREVGWILVNFIQTADCKAAHVHLLLETLRKNKLLKTKEGLAIWLTMVERFPKIQRIPGVWVAEHPLASGNDKTLARVLADSAIAGDEELEDLGEHVWSPSLHFAWPIIFRELTKDQRPSKHVDFPHFWSQVIDKTFLQATASSERKYTGLLAVAEMVKICRPGDYQHVFSREVVNTMSTALNPLNDTNLAESAHGILEAVESVSSQFEQHAVELVVMIAITNEHFKHDHNLQRDMLDIILQECSVQTEQILTDRLRKISEAHAKIQQEQEHTEQRKLLNLSLSFVQSLTKKALTEENTKMKRLALIEKVLLNLPATAFSKSNHDRLSNSLESLLKSGVQGEVIFQRVVISQCVDREFGDSRIDDSVQKLKKEFLDRVNHESLYSELVTDGRQSQLDAATNGNDIRQFHTERGWLLLIVTLIFQLCSEDEDSLELLDEAHAMLEDFGVKRMGERRSLAVDRVDEERQKKATDAVVELCVTLASKPSRLLRRMSLLVLQCFTDLVTLRGLGSLGDIICAKENRQGQQELFADGSESEVETNESDSVNQSEDEEDSSDDDDDDSHIEDMDSDVEVISVSGHEDEDSNSDSGSSSSGTDEDSESNDMADPENDQKALADLDEALASALGTRAFTQADLEVAGEPSETDSDLDMTDSEMAPLDEKLAELFRNRVTQKSMEKTKAQERKMVKENIVNLKNRALDMAEAYLQTVLQRRLGRGLECVEVCLTLFEAAKVASGQQIAAKALGTAESWLKKCRGAKVPDCEPWSDNDVVSALENCLQRLHSEVLVTETRNDVVHAAAQLNVLIANMLVRAGKKKAEVVDLVKEAGHDTYIENSQRTALDGSTKKEKERQKYLKAHKRSKGKEAYKDLWKRFEAWAEEGTQNLARQVTQANEGKVDDNTSTTKSNRKNKRKSHKKSISAS